MKGFSKSNLMDFLLEDIQKYEGKQVPVKAGLLERLLVRNLRCEKLHPNPDDEFCMPSIGPNYGIISDYERKIRAGKLWEEDPNDEPLYVEKVKPDGYLILNGHHRWAAAMSTNRKRVPVRIVNVALDTDIDNMLKSTDNDKRVAFDLDEVIISDTGVNEKKPFLLPRSLSKMRVRLGVPALVHYLVVNGYDIWVYSMGYWSEDDIRRFLKAHHIKFHGVIAGYTRRRWKQMKVDEQIEKKIMNKYSTTLNVTSDELIKITKPDGVFEQYELDRDPYSWSKSALRIIKSWKNEK